MAVLTGGRRNGVAVLTGVVVLMRALLQENVWPAGGQKSNVIMRLPYYQGGRNAGFHCT